MLRLGSVAWTFFDNDVPLFFTSLLMEFYFFCYFCFLQMTKYVKAHQNLLVSQCIVFSVMPKGVTKNFKGFARFLWYSSSVPDFQFLFKGYRGSLWNSRVLRAKKKLVRPCFRESLISKTISLKTPNLIKQMMIFKQLVKFRRFTFSDKSLFFDITIPSGEIMVFSNFSNYILQSWQFLQQSLRLHSEI